MNKLHILYTEEEGGDYHYVAKNTDEETRAFYEDTKKTGYLIYSIGDRTVKVSPAYIALAEMADDYDFVLKNSRLHPKDTPEGAAVYAATIENPVPPVQEPGEEVKNDQ